MKSKNFVDTLCPVCSFAEVPFIMDASLLNLLTKYITDVILGSGSTSRGIRVLVIVHERSALQDRTSSSTKFDTRKNHHNLSKVNCHLAKLV